MTEPELQRIIQYAAGQLSYGLPITSEVLRTGFGELADLAKTTLSKLDRESILAYICAYTVKKTGHSEPMVRESSKPAAGGSIRSATVWQKRATRQAERGCNLAGPMAGPWLSHKAFESLVQEALKGLPANFRRHLENVAIEIAEEPSTETLSTMGIAHDGPDELLGLYVGRSIQGHSFFDTGGELPDQVYIYRGPILRACGTTADVIREVQDTVVHEIGHHFGLSDEDMPV